MMRVIVNGVSFYTTQSRVKSGVGDNTLYNTAVRLCFEEMGRSVGFAKNYTIYDHKMKPTVVSVQLDRM
jgi:hypothetical protein